MKNEKLIMSISIVLLILITFNGFSSFGMMNGWNGGMMNMMYNYGFGGMWLFGWLFMVLIIVALVLFILWLIRQLQTKDRGRR